jgi:hypothetical protein
VARTASPAHGVAADEDQAAADEPDPGDDLGSDAGGVEDDVILVEHVREAIGADEHEQRSA